MEKHFYKISTEYRGKQYCGWQIQPVDKTIQGEINRCLQKLCNSQDVQTLGASRTDAGVHALEQVFKASIPLKLPPKAVIDGLNGMLPGDIKILDAKVSDAHFHPLRDALWKEYIYLFSPEKETPFSRELLAQSPKALDFELMREGAKLFLGTHDFSNFRCTGTEVPTTTREILEIELNLKHAKGPWGDFEYYALTIKGTGFLKQMARLIMGSLWNLGRGKITLQELEDAIFMRVNKKVGPVAPPMGLYLKKIQF